MTETLHLPSGVGLTFGSSVATRARVLNAQFGMGYSQRSGDGINPLVRELSVRMENLSRSEIEAIVTFFRARQGFEAFYYTLPGESEPGVWVCQEWHTTYTDAMHGAMSMTWQEVFEP